VNTMPQGYTSSAILVVEDNTAQLKTLTDILATEGLQPIGCLTGSEALVVCQQHDIHVAILDLHLPDLDGLDVLKGLKEQTPDMKVIINTGYATLEAAMAAVNQEAFAFVQKMGDVAELLAHVHRAFHAHLAGYSTQLEREVRHRTAELSAANDALRQEISERKRVEEEIRTLNAEVELRVKQRTAELEGVNRELQEFAYVASHDLKAPLNGISRLAQWIVEDYREVIDAKGQEFLELLIGRVKRMNNLINGILEYSRVGRKNEQVEPIDLNSLVAEVIDILAPPERIQIAPEPDLPVILGDRTRITQVFQNLLDNALKFMDKPTGLITIRCVDAGSFWTFSVTDNGSGIDARHHERIFRIFQTITPRDERENTGIGLSIVKKIVELYGGKIWVESELGKGSTFFFTFPKKSQ
jgi:signal transduction histidine kinase